MTAQHDAMSRDAGDVAGAVLLRGYVLRAWLVTTLRGAGLAMTVGELVDALERAGLRTHGRASKDVSDALRWEVRRGRVRRTARATYGIGHLPRQTALRMRRRVHDHLAGARGTTTGTDDG